MFINQFSSDLKQATCSATRSVLFTRFLWLMGKAYKKPCSNHSLTIQLKGFPTHINSHQLTSTISGTAFVLFESLRPFRGFIILRCCTRKVGSSLLLRCRLSNMLRLCCQFWPVLQSPCKVSKVSKVSFCDFCLKLRCASIHCPCVTLFVCRSEDELHRPHTDSMSFAYEGCGSGDTMAACPFSTPSTEGLRFQVPLELMVETC